MTNRPRVSLCMIVRNEEAHLAACLQSVRDLVDDMIVVDTGSTDRVRGLLAQRQFATVRRLLDGLIDQTPHALWARLALSYAYLQEGRDWPAAERALRAVLELDPEHAEARHNLALLLNQQGRTGTATREAAVPV